MIKEKIKELVENCERICIWEFVRGAGYRPKTLFSYGKLKFTFQVHFTSKGTMMSSHTIEFTSSQTNFGGKRIWFVCPFCLKRKGVLYRPYDMYTYRCVSCHDLAYSSQNRHREFKYEMYDKFQIQKKKIEKRLRNKYRRFLTKNKLRDKLNCLDAQTKDVLINQICKKFKII